MLVVKVDDLNDIKVEPEEVHPMYSPVSYNAGYNQALKDIGITWKEFENPFCGGESHEDS